MLALSPALLTPRPPCQYLWSYLLFLPPLLSILQHFASMLFQEHARDFTITISFWNFLHSSYSRGPFPCFLRSLFKYQIQIDKFKLFKFKVSFEWGLLCSLCLKFASHFLCFTLFPIPCAVLSL